MTSMLLIHLKSELIPVFKFYYLNFLDFEVKIVQNVGYNRLGKEAQIPMVNVRQKILVFL